jgi:ferredoxin-NADP reductase
LKEQQPAEVLKAYQPLTVSKIIDESDTIRSFYLTPKNGKLTVFQPGQFLPLKLDIPGQDQPVYRTYTISNAPGEDHYRLSIKREDAPAGIPDAHPGVCSTYFHQHVAEGTQILAANPRGAFVLDTENDLPQVFISAGVGITPMMSMLEAHLEQQGSSPAYFIHGARNGKAHAFKNRIQEIQRDHVHVKPLIAYSQPTAADTLEKIIRWKAD